MRSEGAANRWSLNSRGGGSVTGVWEHAENSRHNPSTAEYFTRQMMRPAVSAVKQLLRVVVQRENHWRSHFVMSNPGARMGLRRAPFAFTEHGALMAATVLNSPRAVETSVYVVRAFIRLRRFLATHKDLARRLEEHEKKLSTHDRAIAGLMNTIRTLMAPREPPKRRPIGFVNPDEKKRG